MALHVTVLTLERHAAAVQQPRDDDFFTTQSSCLKNPIPVDENAYEKERGPQAARSPNRKPQISCGIGCGSGANDASATTSTITAAPAIPATPAAAACSISSSYKAGRVAVGALALTMATYGLMSALGLLQLYWQEHQLRDRSATDISWIGSLFGFLSCLFGIASGVAFDHRGVNLILPAACVVYWAAFLALAWCTTYAHFMACFVVAGTSAAVPATAAFCAVEQWFVTKRALAAGLVSTGAPFGGLLFSLSLRALFAQHDWNVSMLWLSSIIGSLVFVGALFVRDKKSTIADTDILPGEASLENAAARHAGNEAAASSTETGMAVEAEQPSAAAMEAWWNLSHFANKGFISFTFCVFAFEFVLYTQWGSLPWFAALTSLGDAFMLQMTYNLGAVLGRTVPSWLAVHWGPFNVILSTTAIAILTVFVLWVPFGDHNAAALYTATFLMGAGTGSFVPLSATCLSYLCDDRGYGKWLGSCYTIIGFASLISNPVNQAVLAKAGPRVSVVFQGILLVIALVVCVMVRRKIMEHKQIPPARLSLQMDGESTVALQLVPRKA